MAMASNSLVPSERFDRAMLRAERARKGLTQQELADLAGVSVQTIKLLEAGNLNDAHDPRVETVQRIAQALDVHWAAFFGIEIVQ